MNPWTYKPWWCQPWSILLTGITIIGGSWVLFKTIWVTVLIALPILTWMGFFLLIWPEMIRQSNLDLADPTAGSDSKSPSDPKQSSVTIIDQQ